MVEGCSHVEHFISRFLEGFVTMTGGHDAFKKREQGLENEFFHRVDQELIQRLKQKAEVEKGREQLAQVTGLSDPAVLDELLGDGIGAETLVALSLVPLIRVAYADKVLERREREAILRAADDAGITEETASYALLSQWLERDHSEKLFEAWKHYVRALGDVVAPEKMQQLEADVTARARKVAEAAGGFLGIHTVSAAEKAVLAEIADAFSATSEH
jgi:hypothetical protein